jgi:hypothetical protein
MTQLLPITPLFYRPIHLLVRMLGVLLLLGVFLPRTADATHFRGQYIYAEPTGNANEVRITAVQFWRWTAFGSNFGSFDDGNEVGIGDLVTSFSSISLGDGNSYSGSWEVIGFDSAKDWVVIRTEFIHQYSTSGTYTVGISGCCRISTLENGWADEDYVVESQILVDNTNISVTTSSGPFVGVPQGTNVTYQIPFTNPDGDQIRFRLASPSQAGAGFSDINPPNLSIDPLTGLITWDNSGLTQGSLHALQVIIEEYDPGVDPATSQPKATVGSDFIFEIGSVGNSLPVCTLDPTSPITIDLGQTVNIDVTGSDATGDADDTDANGNTVSVTATSIPIGSTLSPNPVTGPSPQVATFSWTPGTTGTFNAQFSVGDGLASTLCTATINVQPPQQIDTTPPICADIELEFDGPGGAISAVNTAASDPESGIASATFTTLQNLDGFVGGFGPFVEGDAQVFDPASTPSVDIRGERISYTAGGAIVVTVENGAGLTSDCDPVVEQISASIPERTALLGNYPNPAVGSTTIEVRVAEPGPVRLEVYDLLGRKVSTLLNREMTPGTYQVEWTRSETAQLASGTYIYRLAAGSVTESRRLTLLR